MGVPGKGQLALGEAGAPGEMTATTVLWRIGTVNIMMTTCGSWKAPAGTASPTPTPFGPAATTTCEETDMSIEQTMRADPDAEIDAFIDSVDPATMRDGRHLRAVAAARKSLEAAEDALREAVAAARAAGDSWTMIGLMIGTSKQAAHRKFGRSRGI
jgi:hypothetical protein